MKNRRTRNYSAFYVIEPFNPSNLGVRATEDFCYYNMLNLWKAKDSSFPFVNAHAATYNVRDRSDWEKTLKPRLHKRLNLSKNIILFLSKNTKSSRALKEEIKYGIKILGLPIIVIYPHYKEESDLLCKNGKFKKEVENLWDKLPIFRSLMPNIPTLHIPMKKEIIRKALNNNEFTIQNKCKNGIYVYE